MPNVSPYELSGNNGSGWVAPTSVSGYDGSWKNGFAVYYHNGTSWVEVWNARPEVVSSSMATTSTGLTFSGTADPNNFLTTAKFEYKEVGAGSYTNSGTTTTGMGDGVDGAVSFTVTATVADTYKNWESRASATNAGGTGTGSTVTLDCRKHDAGGSGWGTSATSYSQSNCAACDGCGTSSRTVTETTYSKSGCQTYGPITTYGTCTGCGTWSPSTVSSFESGGNTFLYDGTPGYYTELFSNCTTCPPACVVNATYYVEDCSLGGRRLTLISCNTPCMDIFNSTPC